MNSVQQWLQFFERVSCFYKERMLRFLWSKYPEYATDIWDSLAIFLEGYAFERQGRKPDYFHAAVDALLIYKKQKGDLARDAAADKIWKLFSSLLNGQKLNEQNNPLCPNGTEYKRKDKGTHTRQLSVIEVVSNNKDILDKCFAAYFRGQICRDRDIQNTLNVLKSVQGISDKIASFYLRDLAYVMKIDLRRAKNRHLLQPVDVWVARTVIHLDRNEFSCLKQKIEDGGKLSNKEKTSLAKWIISKSEKNAVNPELVNMGIWYFCSRVATSEYRLNKALNDLNFANDLVCEHAMWIKNASECFERIGRQ